MLALILALSASSASANSMTIQEQVAAAMRRPVSDVERQIRVNGDNRDARIEVSSMGATHVTGAGRTNDNSFLRAFIDRKTGKVTAEVYHVASYGASGWKLFNRASYQSAGGVKEAATVRVGSNVDCKLHACTYAEDVVVPIDFAALEAGKLDPANPLNGLKYRLTSQSGETVEEEVPANEIAAFVNVVRRAGGK